MGATDRQITWLQGLPEYELMVEQLGGYNDKKDYVGAEGSWKSKLIPRKFWGVDVNVAAFVHDYKFSIGGNATDRFYADAGFLVDMLQQIEFAKLSWFKWSMARRRALKYHGAVRIFGESAFNYHDK